MPEGPECKILSEGLDACLKGKCITGLRVVSGRYTRKPLAGLEKFQKSLPAEVKQVKCRGKFIWFKLLTSPDETFIFNTLGMTGGWTRHATPATRIELDYDDGTLYFNDQRNFGTLKVNMTWDDLLSKLHKDLGDDLLTNPECIPRALRTLQLARCKSKTLPEVLMNQKNFPGVGNYVKAEVLYRARLSPHRTPESLSDEETRLLVQSVADVLRESYASKKMTLVDYRETQECGQDFEKVVYKRDKDPLGNPVKAEKTKDKRTTYWVPAVQR